MYNIQACMFKRTEDGEWEPGLLIDEGAIIIAAEPCESVFNSIYDIRREEHHFCLNMTPIFENLKSGYKGLPK